MMKKSIKAALLSGLVFPGLGHLMLKYYVRGSILLGIGLLTLGYIVIYIQRQMLAIIANLENSHAALNMQAITQQTLAITEYTSSPMLHLATTLLLLCWFFGLIDAYRLGKQHDLAKV